MFSIKTLNFSLLTLYVNTRCFVIESVKFNGVMANGYKDRLPKEENLTPFLTFHSTLLIKLIHYFYKT